MRILFDHGTPRGLARELPGHAVKTAKDMGWEQLSNGELLTAAEGADFQLLLTTDQRIRYQQNLTGRRSGILVLSGTTKWSRVRLHCDRVAAAVAAATSGSYTEVFIPFEQPQSPSESEGTN